MFERYTERARRVIFFARYEASVLGSSSIDTEHLLLGLLREGGGLADRILQRSQVTHRSVQTEIESRRLAGEPASTAVDIPLSSAARSALQRAADEAERLMQASIGPEALLIGLLEERESLAAEILMAKGLRVDEVREEIRLQSKVPAGPGRPRDAFRELLAFVGELEARGAAYHVTSFRREAHRVEVAVPDERWVVTFFPAGRVAVEVFSPTGTIEGETALSRLLERLGPPRRSAD
jgi:ATP-dependent Clp protease ATP-binding subunit ClpA